MKAWLALLLLALAAGQRVLAGSLDEDIPIGGSFGTATVLPSQAVVSVSGTTRGFPSSQVSTCNAVADDGPDRFYSYRAPVGGVLTARACASWGPVVTIFRQSINPSIPPVAVACGTCTRPARVKTDRSNNRYFVVVTGTKPTAQGPFSLRIQASAPGVAQGSSFDKPIVLGSAPRVRRVVDTSVYADTSLGGCIDPTNYPPSETALYTGDGPDVFLRWTAPADGFITAAACSSEFQASLTVLGNGTDAEGEPIVNGNLGCGGVFNGCQDPNLNDPDSQLVLEVTKGESFIMAITGTEPTDYGQVQLNVDFSLPGASFQTATFLDLSEGSLAEPVDTRNYPSTYASSCNQGRADGPDRYYSIWTPTNGTLTVSACSESSFSPTVTVLAEPSVLGGPITAKACGTCDNPATFTVAKNKFFYVIVSGNKIGNAGEAILTATVA